MVVVASVVEENCAKKLVAVAFRRVAFVAKRDASVAPVAERLVVEALLIVAVPVVLVLVNEAPVAERLVVEAVRMVACVIVVVARVVVPVTVSDDAVVVARVVVPVIST